MLSRWYHLKTQAMEMRKGGTSISVVEKSLKIPRSTLSGWFKNVSLTSEQKSALEKNRRGNLKFARIKAVLWHNQQKQQRLEIAAKQATNTLSKIDIHNKSILELALAMLYLGEGFKKNDRTGLGNSDPLILKFFIAALKNVYNYDTSKIKCYLHLRADQDPVKLKKYWSKELGIPLSNFINISIDKRTIDRPTYAGYKGVCSVNCGDVAIQRQLMYLSQRFCEQIANIRAVSSVGRASA